MKGMFKVFMLIAPIPIAYYLWLFVFGGREIMSLNNPIAAFDALVQKTLPMQSCPFSNQATPPNLHNPNSFIAHAGGGVLEEGEFYSYTNSKEAVLHSLENGYKFIELDLMLDSSGEIFAAHDYEHFYTITNAPKHIDRQSPPSKDYIKNARIHQTLSPITLEGINELFLAHPQSYLVTDKLNDFQAITSQLKFQDRIIVEIFGLKAYYKAKRAGIVYPMLSSGDFAQALRLKIPMLASHTSDIIQNKQAAMEYIKAGGCIMVYSSNEKAFMANHLGESATAFYTDWWDLQSGQCSRDNENCQTY